MIQAQEKTELAKILTDAQRTRLQEIAVDKLGGSPAKPADKKPNNPK